MDHMQDTKTFAKKILEYYQKHGRHELPWRKTDDPYSIMVSEIMLQQTQVNRVVPKYEAFLKKFPTTKKLADAKLADVLSAWSGLGYNRRARYLHEAAKKIESDFGGRMPTTIQELTSLPGIGTNTAAAILAYAFHKSVTFIETNIRTVFIHDFFKDKIDVKDADLMPLIEATIEDVDPQEFYWALMDYGTHLKATIGNAARRSKHYVKQSKFEGSKRQVRGRVLKALAKEPQSFDELMHVIEDDRLDDALNDLCKEELVSLKNNTYHLG